MSFAREKWYLILFRKRNQKWNCNYAITGNLSSHFLKTRQLTSKTTYLNPVSGNPTKWSNTLKVNNNVIAVEEITLIKNN